MSNKLTPGQQKKITDAVKRVDKLPRGKWQGASTYRPGLTLLLIGKLDEELAYDDRAKFKQWAAPQPDDETSDEAELTDYTDDVYCYNWTFLQSGETLPSGSRVLLAWIAGRWYVVDSVCPGGG